MARQHFDIRNVGKRSQNYEERNFEKVDKFPNRQLI
jgi:hypothetical protein